MNRSCTFRLHVLAYILCKLVGDICYDFKLPNSPLSLLVYERPIPFNMASFKTPQELVFGVVAVEPFKWLDCPLEFGPKEMKK